MGEIIDGAVAAGTTAAQVAVRMAVSLPTLQRWRGQFAGDGGRGDRHKGSTHHVAHQLRHQERQRIMVVCNQPHYAPLPPAQIVRDLAGWGDFIAFVSSFYRVLLAHHQV